jgi:hypothetical protein
LFDFKEHSSKPCSKKETVPEKISSIPEDHPTTLWSPAYDEYCFGDSPDDVNNKLPEQFGTVEWDTLPLAYEYKLDEVRYFIIAINKFDNTTKFIPPHIYVSSSSFICFMFNKKSLFRISVRLIHDDRAPNYKNLVEAYARAVNTPLLDDGMFRYEDERIIYYSNQQDDHTAIETIQKNRVLPDGNIWNPYPSDKISQKSINSSKSEYLYDLMINYSHQDKEICHKIYHKLIDDGFKVWIDLENMYRSTISRMAEAIQNSEFIIICMSHRYQTSPYCQTEGEYTYKLQRSFIPLIVEKDYKPNGWLGALIGLRMYIDFNKFHFDVAYQNLITEIKRNKKQQ